MTAKQFVLMKCNGQYNNAGASFGGLWTIYIFDKYDFCVTGKTARLAWQNAKTKIEEMEKGE